MKEKMMKEADKRMKILEKQGLFYEAMEVWQNGQSCFSEPKDIFGTITGVVYTFEELPELNDLKKWLEKKYDCIVYHGIYYSNIQTVFFLFVSENEEEWENDRANLEIGHPMIYAVDMRTKTVVDINYVNTKMVQGGLVLCSGDGSEVVAMKVI